MAEPARTSTFAVLFVVMVALGFTLYALLGGFACGGKP